MTAEVVQLRPPPVGSQTRRRRSFQHWTGYERRKKSTAAFDIAHALEINLVRHPTREQQCLLLKEWLDVAKRRGLEKRYDGYVKAIEKAIAMVSKAPTAEEAIAKLRR